MANMTVPEQHAATVERLRASVLNGLRDPRTNLIDVVRDLDELVALAGRAQEDADGSRFLRGLADASSDNWRARAEAAEARADELQRQLDALRSAERLWREQSEQARREADQLRAALREIVDQETVELILDPTWSQRIARAALAGVQADNKDSA